MKCHQSRSGFELVSPCPFPTTITVTPRAPPVTIYNMNNLPFQYTYYILIICKQFHCWFSVSNRSGLFNAESSFLSSGYIVSSNYSYLIIIIYFHTFIWYKVFLSNTNNLYTFIRFGTFNGISTFYWLFNVKIGFISKCLIGIIIIYIFNCHLFLNYTFLSIIIIFVHSCTVSSIPIKYK